MTFHKSAGQIIRRVFNIITDAIRVDSDDTKFYYEITETVNSSLTYIGQTKTYDSPDESTAIWRISRVTQQGKKQIIEQAFNGSGQFAFDQIWDNRAALFPDAALNLSLSLNFDGVNDHLNGGNIFPLDMSDAFSFSIYVKPQNVAAQRTIFAKATNDANVYGYTLYHTNTGALFLQMRTSGTLESFTFNKSLTAGVWNHVVFTYNGGSNINGAHIYVNASKSNTPTSGTLGSTWDLGQDFTVGSRNQSFYFSGGMVLLSLFNKELTQAEVTELYNSGAPINVSAHSAAASLVSSYAMGNNDVYPDIYDLTSTDDLVMQNMSSDDFVSDVP